MRRVLSPIKYILNMYLLQSTERQALDLKQFLVICKDNLPDNYKVIVSKLVDFKKMPDIIAQAYMWNWYTEILIAKWKNTTITSLVKTCNEESQVGRKRERLCWAKIKPWGKETLLVLGSGSPKVISSSYLWEAGQSARQIAIIHVVW